MDETTPQPISSKPYLSILMVILVLLIIGGGIWYFLSARTPSTKVEIPTPTAPTATPTTPPPIPTTGTTSKQQIKSDSDAELQAAASDLDGTNVDTSIDTALNQNEADLTQF